MMSIALLKASEIEPGLGVSRIIPGTGITISPESGKGNVSISGNASDVSASTGALRSEFDGRFGSVALSTGYLETAISTTGLALQTTAANMTQQFSFAFSSITDILQGEATPYLTINGSTQTKIGGLNISGNVGIGSTSPSQKLFVGSAGDNVSIGFGVNSGDSGVKIRNINDVAGEEALTFHTKSVSGASERFRISGSGGVGVGTTDAPHKLVVAGGDSDLVYLSNANLGVELRSSAADADMYMDFSEGSTDISGIGTPDNSMRMIYKGTSDNSFQIANISSLFSMHTNGTVGINTNSPSSKFNVKAGSVTVDGTGAAMIIKNDGTGAGPSQLVLQTVNDGGAGIQFANSDFPSNFFQLFLANDGTGLKIGRDSVADYVLFGNGGSVGINTSVLSSKLDVVGGSITTRGTGAGYAINGAALFSVAGSTAFEVFRTTAGAINANTTLTLSNTVFGLSAITGAGCSEVEGVNTPGVSVRLKDTVGNNQIQIFNSDVVNLKKFSCWVAGNP